MSNIRSLEPTAEDSDEVWKEQWSHLVWVGMIVGLLVLQIVMSVTAAIIATNSHSNDIVPDYYQKALHYDELHATSVIKES
ncbi:FixH family protein [Bremerella sp. JC817]|uniref:FixH family protein n=1 Tax=Bremerella sp. JC817 TaxID=3231756 RepID=UPI003457EF45